MGEEKLYVRGVTYGTFAADSQGDQYGTPEKVASDFAAMATSGINAVRTYTVPPRWLLDLALEHNLWVMAGIPWEQHVAFLEEPKRARIIETKVREGARSCAGHAALLCFSVGNEIPASIVRWHGRRRCEQHIQQLCEAVKSVDADALVTYVNYPTTEYLNLPFLDLMCFNVFLEARSDLESYLARLQNLAADKPLVLTEIGLDSRRNGEQLQAEGISWQIESAFQSGCAGTFVFSWTDEWSRGGCDIEDWDFGLTRRDRTPKPALAAVQRAYREVPFSGQRQWPKISVVVCSYNGAATIGESLQHLHELRYPNFETIVVDDGSTNNVSEIARQIGASRVIRVPNGGLSRARNIGLQAATGEIVAYIDDDAYPDPHWLHYLAHTFMTTDYAAVGGPNIPPPGDGPVADCVARSPGGPTHVLVSDSEAEHIPGCNMAFRKVCLERIGGFDPQFRVAGDDVDVCWSLQQQGWKLGFNPGAVVWHHRRNSVRAYWKQQQGYGKAEALLEKKWPEKYNIVGHPAWRGRVYGNGHGWTVGRVYHGVWGSAPFQSLYERGPGMLRSMLLMPEWFLLVIVLSSLSALGFAWDPLLAAVPLLMLSTAVPLVQAIRSARRSGGLCKAKTAWQCTQQQGVVVCLHLIQPMARLWGRLRHGITPWRLRGRAFYGVPWPRTPTIWSERWRSEEDRLRSIENSLRPSRLLMVRGGEYDRWELEARGGPLGAARLRMVLEEHGGGRQLGRFRIWPKVSALVAALICIFAGLTIWAVLDNSVLAAIALGGITSLLVSGTLQQCAAGMGGFLHTLAVEEESERAAILAAAGVPATATADLQVPVNGASDVIPASSWIVSSESAREIPWGEEKPPAGGARRLVVPSLIVQKRFLRPGHPSWRPETNAQEGSAG